MQALKSLAAIAASFLLGISHIHAEDWTMPDGGIFCNITIISHDSTVVTFSYDPSPGFIRTSDLSKAIQQGVVGSKTIPISSLGNDIQQRILNDHATALKWAVADGKEDQYKKAASDLCSPNPEVRSRAAKAIREDHLYKATLRDPWDKLASELKNGETYQEAIAYLHTKGIALQQPIEDTPPNGVFHFRLDNSWVLLCAINQAVLTEFKVTEEPLEIQVPPPTGYSGYWRSYRINGERILRLCFTPQESQ